MRHPTNSVLLDYFENALNPVQESLVKEHLLLCDDCTRILSEMAITERRLREVSAPSVSKGTEQRLFQEARLLLQEKRLQAESKVRSAEAREQRQREWHRRSRELWSTLQDLRTPALQFCSLSLVLVAIVTAEKLTTDEEYRYEPISTKVESFEHNENIQAEEGR